LLEEHGYFLNILENLDIFIPGLIFYMLLVYEMYYIYLTFMFILVKLLNDSILFLNLNY
jgi:hypothetical protein